MGRKPVPISILKDRAKTHLTKKQIEEREQKENAARLPSDNIQAPSWLCDRGQFIFNNIVSELKRAGMVSNLDVYLLSFLADAIVDYQSASVILREEGTYIEHTNASNNTNKVSHPLTSEKKRSFEQAYKICGDYGLSFTSLLKIANLMPAKKEEKPETPFEKKFGDV